MSNQMDLFSCGKVRNLCVMMLFIWRTFILKCDWTLLLSDQPLAEDFPLSDGQVNVRCPLNLPTGARYVIACEFVLLHAAFVGLLMN